MESASDAEMRLISDKELLGSAETVVRYSKQPLQKAIPGDWSYLQWTRLERNLLSRYFNISTKSS